MTIVEENSMVEPGVLIDGNKKQVKFDLCNVSKTNDAYLSRFSLVESGVRLSPLYEAFDRLIGPGGWEISHLLTLGNSPIPIY